MLHLINNQQKERRPLQKKIDENIPPSITFLFRDKVKYSTLHVCSEIYCNLIILSCYHCGIFYHKISKKHCYLADAPFGFLVCILQPRVLTDTELLVVHAGAWLRSQRLPSVLILVILNGTVKEYHCVTVNCKTMFVCV